MNNAMTEEYGTRLEPRIVQRVAPIPMRGAFFVTDGHVPRTNTRECFSAVFARDEHEAANTYLDSRDASEHNLLTVVTPSGEWLHLARVETKSVVFVEVARK